MATSDDIKTSLDSIATAIGTIQAAMVDENSVSYASKLSALVDSNGGSEIANLITETGNIKTAIEAIYAASIDAQTLPYAYHIAEALVDSNGGSEIANLSTAIADLKAMLQAVGSVLAQVQTVSSRSLAQQALAIDAQWRGESAAVSDETQQDLQSVTITPIG